MFFRSPVPFHHMKAVEEILEMKPRYLVVTSQVVSGSSDGTGRVVKVIM